MVKVLAAAAVALVAGSAMGQALPGTADGVGWVPNGNNIFFTGGNASIGTTNPAYRLYVVGTGPATIVASNPTQALVSVGVQGQAASTTGRGIYGFATALTGGAYGGLFRSLSDGGVGVFGIADAGSGATIGVRGQSASTTGTGVWGVSTPGTGDVAGVRGQAASNQGTGVIGLATANFGETNGVYGESSSPSGAGLFGFAASATGTNYGVYGETGNPSAGYGVYSIGPTAATGTKAFQIDHPLDPANRMLNHYSAEGPEPYLVYRGTAVLGADGRATVELPEYFGVINRDPHYQLTPIGAPAVLYIEQEVVDNRFVVAGGKPGMKVSWTVTGVRNDAFVQRYGAPAERVKAAGERGKFLHPELYGQPATRALRRIPARIEPGPVE